ncbi:MAG: hypothetical protein ABR498_02535, partial [Candidatus Dormibacteria bacterium]
MKKRLISIAIACTGLALAVASVPLSAHAGTPASVDVTAGGASASYTGTVSGWPDPNGPPAPGCPPGACDHETINLTGGSNFPDPPYKYTLSLTVDYTQSDPTGVNNNCLDIAILDSTATKVYTTHSCALPATTIQAQGLSAGTYVAEVDGNSQNAGALPPQNFTGTVAATASIPASTGLGTSQSGNFTVGVPTIVDPIRGVGEPDITVDNTNNAEINGPGGSATQTSFFWKSRDGGLTYPLLGPTGGHWLCSASGGGDGLSVIDRATNDLYLTDQESLADLGTGKLAANGSLTSACASAPAVSADRPFEAVLNTGNSTAPQSIADGNKPVVYLSYLCQGCAGGTVGGGLAYGWTDDGVTFHPAEPGVSGTNLATNNFQEAASIHGFQWHGPMVADPTTGYVFTGISCSGSCPSGATDPSTNQFGVAVGKPFANPTTSDPTNVGQFESLSYETAAEAADPGSLFPVLTMDSAHTLYLLWTQGDGAANTGSPVDDTSWHIYYSYSLDTAADGHMHKTWSAPIKVDSGAQTATSVMGWVVAGDPGHLGFIWLGTSVREHPSASNTAKQWFPYMAVTTNGNTANPTFLQQQVGIGPNHIGDICLQGTVGCITSVGNRNMADFISVDIGPNGSLQGTWANDANQLATLPSTLIPGLPITETAVQTGGPQLIGSGTVNDTRFSAAPTTSGIGDFTGDGLYPVQGGSNVKQLDLTGSRIEWNGSNLLVHISASDLSSLTSPDAVQNEVWWLTTWQFNHKIYYAKAQSIAGQTPVCTAGLPKSFDRPGLNAQTAATLVDYGASTLAPPASAATVSCTKSGNEFVITVPPSDIGNPAQGSVLEAVTGFSILDDGAPPCLIGPDAPGNPTPA